MKNFIRINSPVVSHGMLLMNIHTAEMYEPFEEYVELLKHKGYALNTIEQYAGHVSRFLDFLYELRVVSVEKNLECKPSKVFRFYQDFLTQGKDSSTRLVSQVSKNIGKNTKTSFTSIANGIEAALSIFIELRMFDCSDVEFFDAIQYEHNTDHRELSKMVRNSWLEATKRSFGSKARSKIKLFGRASRKKK